MPPADVRPGDIYWVEIPQAHTVGSEQYNRRPYVIVSRLLVNRQLKTVVGIPLSTAGTDVTQQPPFRIFIPAQEISRDVAFNSEIKDSIAKVDHIRVIAKERLQNRMGQLSNTALIAVGLGIAFLCDLR